MPEERILIVDYEQVIRSKLVESLLNWGYLPVEAKTATETLAAFEAKRPPLVLLDLDLPDGSGLDLLCEIKRREPRTIVIMIADTPLAGDTITALRKGAYDFIRKPFNLEELQIAIQNGLEVYRLRKELSPIINESARNVGFDHIIGKSQKMIEAIAIAHKAAVNDSPAILIQGESGTGKALMARAIHFESSRASAPFLTFDCTSLPASLIEGELFGYEEQGAITQAGLGNEGLFKQADGGTVLLAGVGEIEESLQMKLLRVLQDGRYRRVGGLIDIPFNARIITATNRDLRTMNFRPDLYSKLSVIHIDLAPLRERGEDTLLLAGHYIAEFNELFFRSIRGLTPEVVAIFLKYEWPGNVRQLRSCIERAVILEEGEKITTKYLPKGIISKTGRCLSPVQDKGKKFRFRLPPGGVNLEDVELFFVRQAIERSRGNKTRAAKLLHISRDQLRYRLKKIRGIAGENSHALKAVSGM